MWCLIFCPFVLLIECIRKVEHFHRAIVSAIFQTFDRGDWGCREKSGMNNTERQGVSSEAPAKSAGWWICCSHSRPVQAFINDSLNGLSRTHCIPFIIATAISRIIDSIHLTAETFAVDDPAHLLAASSSRMDSTRSLVDRTKQLDQPKAT